MAAYLCNKYARNEKQSLYPSDPEQRFQVDKMLYVSEWVTQVIEDYLVGGNPLFISLNSFVDHLQDIFQTLELIIIVSTSKNIKSCIHVLNQMFVSKDHMNVSQDTERETLRSAKDKNHYNRTHSLFRRKHCNISDYQGSHNYILQNSNLSLKFQKFNKNSLDLAQINILLSSTFKNLK